MIKYEIIEKEVFVYKYYLNKLITTTVKNGMVCYEYNFNKKIDNPSEVYNLIISYILKVLNPFSSIIFNNEWNL